MPSSLPGKAPLLLSLYIMKKRRLDVTQPTLRLGMADAGKKPASTSQFFRPLHEGNMPAFFRAERNDTWVPVAERADRNVETFQTQLRAFGFLPHGSISGVFDYRTQSAVRLFQEYVRTVEGFDDIGIADGIAGRKTFGHMERWKQAGQVADWASQHSPSSSYVAWIRLLNAYKGHTAQANGPIQRRIQDLNRHRPTDTLSVADWNTALDTIHLIGVRRRATDDAHIRLNNDVLILLVRGMVFAFFGSTDPSPALTSKPPFLVPGQHRYRFGWHKRSDLVKVYRGFRPHDDGGVLVMRDRDNRRHTVNLKDETILAQAIEHTPNTTINVHWSGRHTTSWSAGCQVVAGGGYINHRDQLIDNWGTAAVNYSTLPGRTRGAYNVLLDLITVFTPDVRAQGGGVLHYTLLNEGLLGLEPSFAQAGSRRNVATGLLRRGLKILDKHDPAKFRTYSQQLP